MFSFLLLDLYYNLSARDAVATHDFFFYIIIQMNLPVWVCVILLQQIFADDILVFVRCLTCYNELAWLSHDHKI